jgi:hypothetical protein
VVAVAGTIGANVLVDDSKSFWQPFLVGVEQMMQQMAGYPRIFGGNRIDAPEHLQGTQRNIGEIPYRCRHYI